MRTIQLRWRLGHDRNGVGSPARDEPKGIADLRATLERRSRRSAALRGLADSLVSLAAIVGTEVKDPAGESIGRLKDVIVRWGDNVTYPPVVAIVVRVGKRDALIDAAALTASAPGIVSLTASATTVRTVERNPDDVALAHDVLDRQIVDKNGLEVVRPADVYLAALDGGVALVGIEIGIRALLRRLGPTNLQRRARPDVAIDWATIGSFAPVRRGAATGSDRAALAGQVGAGLQLDVAAADVRKLRPDDIETVLAAGQREPGKDSQ